MSTSLQECTLSAVKGYRLRVETLVLPVLLADRVELLKIRVVSGSLAQGSFQNQAVGRSQMNSPGTGNTGKGWRQLVAVLLVAAAARALYLVAFVRTPLHDFFRNDHLYYREWGLRIAAGQWLGSESFEQGPLYAYLLGALYRVAGPHEVPVLCAQLLGGLGTVALIWWCARRLWGAGAALGAGLLGPGFLGFLLLGKRRGAPRLTAGFGAVLILEVLLTFNLGRYRTALAAVWLLYAGVGLAWLVSSQGWRAGAGWRARLAGAGVAASLAAFSFLDPPGRDPAALAAAHDLFRRQAEDAVPNPVREKLGEAAAVLSRALVLDAKNFLARYWLGRAYLLWGQDVNALRELEFALRLADPHARSREYLQTRHLVRLIRERNPGRT